MKENLKPGEFFINGHKCDSDAYVGIGVLLAGSDLHYLGEHEDHFDPAPQEPIHGVIYKNSEDSYGKYYVMPFDLSAFEKHGHVYYLYGDEILSMDNQKPLKKLEWV